VGANFFVLGRADTDEFTFEDGRGVNGFVELLMVIVEGG